ncbi:hypothetical protein EB796_024800 [Bugula neritina]|uniref:Uncharacterized protein n=1 Tax=Bugula neritina TaxID=10212 RepID=A0A7J7ISJ0_BUGNE|nr:hypothetical protein EB796_024800 [Bugula neritina]
MQRDNPLDVFTKQGKLQNGSTSKKYLFQLHAGVLTNTSLVGGQRAKSLTPWMFEDNQCVHRKHDALEILKMI